MSAIDQLLAEAARFIEPFQVDPTTHVMYVGEDLTTIAGDLGDVADIEQRLIIERDANGAICAVLGLDIDEELRKIWWFGPWATDPADGLRLVEAATTATQELWDAEEFGPDARNTALMELATSRGCTAAATAIVLSCDSPGEVPPSGRSQPLRADQHGAMAALHDELFPSTHTTGARLAASDESFVRTLAHDDGSLIGYVAVELHHDGSGYVDFVGVAEQHRGNGYGRALIADAVAKLATDGIPRVHLTVRVENEAAQALYRSLGFVEERRIVGMRRSTLRT